VIKNKPIYRQRVLDPPALPVADPYYWDPFWGKNEVSQSRLEPYQAVPPSFYTQQPPTVPLYTQATLLNGSLPRHPFSMTVSKQYLQEKQGLIDNLQSEVARVRNYDHLWRRTYGNH